jgi:CheY-like chemotaxis protein
VVGEVTSALAPSAARHNVRLEFVRPVDVPPPVAADRTRLTQIVMNFASNAIKYNRPGGTVVLALAASEATTVRVTVTDTGVGIPLDKQDKMFQPFQRAGQETGPIEGTGIGLVITKRLAELMGGRVGFRSAPGVGSEFWVDIPVHRTTARMSAAPSATQGSLTQLEGAQRHIVYVEDNPANVAFMRDLLGQFDSINLVTAPTAEIGLELTRRFLPDVVLMDINLPGMSGIDALRAIQTDLQLKHIPVIALTAAASDRDKQRGMQAGFYRYLTKPVRVDELIGALEQLFNRSE